MWSNIEDMAKKKPQMSPAEQSARFREAAKKAEAGDAKAFERVFKKIVPARKPSRAKSK
jgi:hypothetical protein